MSIDLTDCLTLKQAKTEVFADKVSTFSIRRWGVKGIGKPPVKLPIIRVGGVWVIRRQDAEEFKLAMQDPDLYRRNQKSKRVTKARKRLAEAGC
jgi:hypothetical protein